MTIFFHVSSNLDHNGIFYPKIPEKTFSSQSNNTDLVEDSTTPRICVSTSIEGCFTSMPSGGLLFENLLEECDSTFKVFKIDSEKLGIKDSSIVSSDKLYTMNLVPDAEITDEHWITSPFTVPEEDTQIIKITSYSEDTEDIIPHHIYELSETSAYNGDYFKAYMDYYDSKIDAMILIEDIEYEEI